jgi:hypothetical protein
MNKDAKLIVEAYQSIYSGNSNLELLEEFNNHPDLKPWAENLCRKSVDEIVAILRELKQGSFEDFRIKLEYLTHGTYEGKDQFLTKTVPAIRQVLGVRGPRTIENKDDLEHKSSQAYLLKQTDKS